MEAGAGRRRRSRLYSQAAVAVFLAAAALALPGGGARAEDSLGPPGPEQHPADAAPPPAVEAYGEADASCRQWGDGCRICRRQDDGTVACSTPGIACLPEAVICRGR